MARGNIDGIVAAAKADWQQGRLPRKFEDDLADRKVGRGDVVVTLSKRSIIIFYYHHGRERFGFYHPRLNMFVAWSPTAGIGRLLIERLLPRQRKTLSRRT